MQTAIDNLARLESEIIDLVTELYDIFSDADEINNDKQILSGYIKHVAKIGLRVRKSGFIELRDFCITFQEILRGLLKQERPLSNEERENLEVWPSLVLSAITSSSNTEYINEIINYIENPIWKDFVSSEQIKNLHTSFIPHSINKKPHIANEQTYTELESDSDNSFELVQQEILEATSELLAEITATKNNSDLSSTHSALNLCADRIEVLSMSIASIDYMGIMDICSYYQLGLRELSKQTTALRQNQIESIEELPSLLLTYISYPSDTDNIIAIADFLKNTEWITSFTDAESATLKELLISDNSNKNEFNEDLYPSNTANQNKIADADQFINEATPVASDEHICTAESADGDRQNFLASELINLVIEEVQFEKETLLDSANILNSNNDSESKIIALGTYNNTLQRFTAAVESVGLSGLYKILNHIQKNITHYLEQTSLPESTINNFLNTLPDKLLNYLNKLDNIQLTEDLVDALLIPIWPLPFETIRKDIIDELFSPEITVEDEFEERSKLATADDISLALPTDVNQQLLTSLLQELPTQTAEFSSVISNIFNHKATLRDVEHAQRIAHTLKGAANTVGVVGVATLTHHLEDILTAFTKHNKLPNQDLADVLINTADVLEMMSEFLLGIGDEPDQALSVLQQVLDWANQIDKQGIPENSETLIEIATQEQKDNRQTSVEDDNSSQAMLRVPTALMDELLRLAGESIIMGAQLTESLKQASLQNELAQNQNELFQQLIFDLDQIVDIQHLTSKKNQSNLTSMFDVLELEQYNELHTITHRLVEAVTDSKEQIQSMDDELTNLDGLLVEQGRIHKESQDVVMQTRMVPVQNIVPRLQRSIRQTCRFTNKKALLDITGSDTMIDSDVLNEISEPLMHMLRNAIDHGIELADIRKAKNKNETGIITLSFHREGEYIVIRCSDDGAGLNFESIKQTAIEKGLIEQTEAITDDELTRLIGLSGFSTSSKTTQVSGRGIGMSAIHNTIMSMKGSLKIESTRDAGCTFEIRLPLTLISVHSILVKYQDQTLAFSNHGIEQILTVKDGELDVNNETIKFIYDNQTYNAFDIETLLHHPITNKLEREQRAILLVRDETGTAYAITVEQVLANQDLVVKQLGMYVPEIAGIEGATILGNGNIVPVIDLPGLLRAANEESVTPILDLVNFTENEVAVESINALVVDDSLSARRSLAQFIGDMGYDVRMARDGIDAIEAIKEKLPDIIFVDLEMPRMNGLELTSHIRANEKTRHLPIIMVTSRSTEKHRQTATSLGVNAYVTKPFSEDELLEHIDNLLTHNT